MHMKLNLIYITGHFSTCASMWDAYTDTIETIATSGQGMSPGHTTYSSYFMKPLLYNHGFIFLLVAADKYWRFISGLKLRKLKVRYHKKPTEILELVCIAPCKGYLTNKTA
jgi:hypothetical protein